LGAKKPPTKKRLGQKKNRSIRQKREAKVSQRGEGNEEEMTYSCGGSLDHKEKKRIRKDEERSKIGVEQERIMRDWVEKVSPIPNMNPRKRNSAWSEENMEKEKRGELKTKAHEASSAGEKRKSEVERTASARSGNQ